MMSKKKYMGGGASSMMKKSTYKAGGSRQTDPTPAKKVLSKTPAGLGAKIGAKMKNSMGSGSNTKKASPALLRNLAKTSAEVKALNKKNSGAKKMMKMGGARKK